MITDFDYKSQPKDEIAACNLCGGLRNSLISRFDRYGLPVWTKLCAGCGLGFISPRMTKQAYADFYANGTYRKLAAQFTDQAARQASQRNYAKWLTDLLWPHYRGNQARGWILDVGGGDGTVSRVVLDSLGFYAAKVVDPSGESGQTVPFEDYEAEDASVDLILICQTIDHVLDIKGVLEKARRLLNPEGLMFIDAVDFYFVAKRLRNVRGALKVDHPFSLTDATMTAALEFSGFEIRQKDYSTGYHVGYVCARSPYEKTQAKMYNPFYAARLLEDLRDIEAGGVVR